MARFLSIPEAHAVGMVTLLKASALELAPEGDLSGTIRDPQPDEWMAAAVGWDLGEAGRLGSAMRRCGFAIAGPSGAPRVSGLEVYAGALATSEARSKAGKKGASMRWSSPGHSPAIAKPMAPDGNTVANDGQTQTQTHITPPSEGGTVPASPPGDAGATSPRPRTSPSASSPRSATQGALVDVPASPSRAAPAKSSSKVSPDEREARERLTVSYEGLRGEAYNWEGDDWGALRKCLSLAGQDVELLDERWRHGLELGTTWPGVSKLRELASKWGHLGNHLATVGKGTRDVREERKLVGGDVPRIPGMDRLYRDGKG